MPAPTPDQFGGVAAPIPEAIIAGEKLSLAEIANLPGPGHSADLVRRWYDPQFGLGPEPETGIDNTPRWTVTLEYTRSISETLDLEVTAATEDLATQLARKKVRDNEVGDIDFDHVVARRLDQPRVAA